MADPVTGQWTKVVGETGDGILDANEEWYDLNGDGEINWDDLEIVLDAKTCKVHKHKHHGHHGHHDHDKHDKGKSKGKHGRW